MRRNRYKKRYIERRKSPTWLKFVLYVLLLVLVFGFIANSCDFNLSESQDKNLIYSETTQDLSVYLDSNGFAQVKTPVAYYFNKNGTDEGQFVQMTQIGDKRFVVNIPAGYTHVIFIDYSPDGVIGSLNPSNIINKTDELAIPFGTNNTYDYVLKEWKS